MSEYKTTIRGLATGDKVMLRLPDVKGLTDAERENRRTIEATVVAIYPHCILFRTVFNYTICPNKFRAEELVSGVEITGQCPWDEKVTPAGRTKRKRRAYNEQK